METHLDDRPRPEPRCLICGRTENKPMCYRGEPWCCHRHKQEAQRRMANLPISAA